MTFDNEELALIRDALAAFIVGVESYDEAREALIERIDVELGE